MSFLAGLGVGVFVGYLFAARMVAAHDRDGGTDEG